MDVYTTEEQQVEAIRKWWQENKWSLIGGVALGIAVLVGGRAWLENRNSYTETASTVYQVMMEHIAQNRFAEAAEKGKQLLGDFSDTSYAELAALAMAKIKLEEGEATAAASHLRWVLDNSQQEALQHEARMRLARILLAEGQSNEALGLLQGVDYGVYQAAYDALLGDAYLALDRQADARDAYQRAMNSSSGNVAARDVLQMKLDNLNGQN